LCLFFSLLTWHQSWEARKARLIPPLFGGDVLCETKNPGCLKSILHTCSVCKYNFEVTHTHTRTHTHSHTHTHTHHMYIYIYIYICYISRQVEFKYIPQDITPRNRVLLARPAPALPTPITDLSPWPSTSTSGLGSLWKMWEGNGLLFSYR